MFLPAITPEGKITCVDPESFARGDPTFFFSFFFSLMREEESKYHYSWSIIGPPARRHLNGVSLVGRWWPNIEWWIGSLVILRGSGPVLLRNPIFLSFSRGVRIPCPLLWIRTWISGKTDIVAVAIVKLKPIMFPFGAYATNRNWFRGIRQQWKYWLVNFN